MGVIVNRLGVEVKNAEDRRSLEQDSNGVSSTSDFRENFSGCLQVNDALGANRLTRDCYFTAFRVKAK